MKALFLWRQRSYGQCLLSQTLHRVVVLYVWHSTMDFFAWLIETSDKIVTAGPSVFSSMLELANCKAGLDHYPTFAPLLLFCSFG